MFQGYSLTAPLLPVIVNRIATFCFWMRGKREGWMDVSRVFYACLENTDVVGFLFVECTYVGLSRELLKQLHVLLGGHPRASLGSLTGLLPFSSPLLTVQQVVRILHGWRDVSQFSCPARPFLVIWTGTRRWRPGHLKVGFC